MSDFNIKDLADDSWEQIPGQEPYAVRCRKNDVVLLRFGPKLGMYIYIGHNEDGRIVSSIDYESGGQVIVGKIPEKSKIVLGRTSDCGIKVMHAIVSRQHLELYLLGDILIVKDLSSTNGTFLCKESIYFNIDKYLEEHPIEKAGEATLDRVHELFGPALDDFLKSYIQTKGN